jgi:hypothetical protein
MATRKKNTKPAEQEAIVSDPATGLEWSPTFDRTMNFADAKNAVGAYRGGGHDDWRLPTIKELTELIDFGRFKPAANTDLFPDMKSDWYWSGTVLASSPRGYAWVVYFLHGYVGFSYQNNSAFVRAVRSVRAGQ